MELTVDTWVGLAFVRLHLAVLSHVARRAHAGVASARLVLTRPAILTRQTGTGSGVRFAMAAVVTARTNALERAPDILEENADR